MRVETVAARERLAATRVYMRQLRYCVAASLDGYIAGPNGEYDWIPMDPEFDFTALYARYSGIVMGRKAYEISAGTGGGGGFGPKLPVYVYSRTLPPGERKGMTFVQDALAHVRQLKTAGPEKPLWLWGGGELFRELAAADLVDGLDLGIMPILLGGGIPMLPAPASRLPLRLRAHQVYPKTGTLFLEYDIVHEKKSRRQARTRGER
jgi:dihydrofolate reductase